MNRGQNKILKYTNKVGKIVSLQYLQANEAISMLGMYLAPNGNNKDQFKYMHKKATTWETSIISGGVQQNEAWKGLNSEIPQTMKYPLPAMTLNKE